MGRKCAASHRRNRSGYVFSSACSRSARIWRCTGFYDRIGRLRNGAAMKIVDLTHVMNVHTPGWVGYAGNKMYYAQHLQTVRIVAQRIDTALHVGTHFAGALHAAGNPTGAMPHLPMDDL